MTHRLHSSLIGAFTGLLLMFPAHAENAAAPQPSPALLPAEVVKIQLDALRRNGEGDIALVFRFASPGNQAQTGPLEHFAQILRKTYGEMLGHRSTTMVPAVIQGDQAYQGVELIAHDGRTFRYLFVLTRQSEPPYRGCWMTDAVIARPAGDGQPL